MFVSAGAITFRKEGNFKVGAEYEYSYIIDGIYVIDDNGDSIDFNDYTFLWYFTKQ